MLHDFDSDTIVAISTPSGEGGIGIVRLSGPEAIRIADRIFHSKKGTPVSEQKSFTIQYGTIRRGDNGASETVDEVLLTLMKAPASYTKEDVVEISAHGGPAVLQAIVGLAIQAGARAAARGEFTKRAFLNGRIDLLQAEAVLDLIQAKTEIGRRWAAAHLEGGLSKKIKALKASLVDILSHLEAAIDFPEDFPDTHSPARMAERLLAAAKEIRALLKDADAGLIAKRGIRAAIAGRPNAGKSSLLNALARRPRAIVTPYAGTTRDVVEEEVQMEGLAVCLQDTAGLRETEHPVEKEGIQRTKQAVSEADIVLFVVDAAQKENSEDIKLLNDLGGRKALIVFNKMDLAPCLDKAAFLKAVKEGKKEVIEVSSLTGAGIQELEKKLVQLVLGGRIFEASQETVVASVRQKQLLEKTLKNIEDCVNACQKGLSPEFTAADLRQALEALGRLSGEVVTDDLLETLFSQFCIGK